MVRPLCLPRAASRPERVCVARGSMPYSPVTQPEPLPRIHGGTRSSIEAVHKTRMRIGEGLVESLPRDTPLVFHCHHGSRSARAAQVFVDMGFTEVYNVTGGIEAWSARIDPQVPRY